MRSRISRLPPLLALGTQLLACSSAPTPAAPNAAQVLPAPRATATTSVGGGEVAAEPRELRQIDEGRCPTQMLVDDFEDGDAAIMAVDGRDGRWSTYVDKDGSTISPAVDQEFSVSAPGANGSKHAAHIKGKTSGKGNPYAGMGFTFSSGQAFLDASCCKGIAFWAKRAEGTLDTVRVKVGDKNTVPEGGVCQDCFNDFGVDFGFSTEWTRYTLDFATTTQQPYWGEPRPALATSHLRHLHFQVNHPGYDFEVWVDDIALVGCAPEAR